MSAERCFTCDKPIATEQDFRDIPGGEGEHLCWSAYSKMGCEPEDWRDRALRAEAEAISLRRSVRALLESQREACAKVCDSMSVGSRYTPNLANTCAELVRKTPLVYLAEL